jgi:DNA-binding CsgD family transcriptional regulator
MGPDDELLALVAAIYDAALAPQEWPAVLSRLAELMGATCSLISVLPLDGSRGKSMCSTEVDPDIFARFCRDYTQPDTNPSIPHLMAVPQRTIVFREEHFSDAAWERTELYQDIYRALNVHHSLGVILHRSKHHVAPCGVLRRKGAEPFGSQQRALLTHAVPHLERAVEVFLRLHDLQTHKAGNETLWNRLPNGVLFLDAAGRILWTNAAAETILAKGDGLSARGGFLSAAEAAANATLHRLIGEAARTGNGSGFHSGGVLALSRPSALRPLELLVAPFRIHHAEHLMLGGRPCVSLFVTDPERKPRPSPELLAQLYGLTTRESALVALLLEGLDLGAAAQRLDVQMNTVRTHLRQVFEKTNTHRQAELVGVLFRSVLTAADGQPEAGRDASHQT